MGHLLPVHGGQEPWSLRGYEPLGRGLVAMAQVEGLFCHPVQAMVPSLGSIVDAAGRSGVTATVYGS